MDASQESTTGRRHIKTIALVALAAGVSVACVIVWHSIRQSLFEKRERARLTLSKNNLKLISLAMIQREQRPKSELIMKILNRGVEGSDDPELSKKLGYVLQQAICNADGKPLLSWRVAILPYIDNALYQRFHLDEAWDSPSNKELITEIPDVYCSPGRPKDGKTLYLQCVGEETPFPAHPMP